MAEVVWSEAAAEKLNEIVAYIRVNDPDAAIRIGLRLQALAESLCDFPHRGRPVADGKRELASIPPYVLRYRVAGDTVFILGVRHGRLSPNDRPTP